MWIQVITYTDEAHSALIGDQLQLLGAEAVTYQDAGDTPIYEPALDTISFWQKTTITALFNEQTNLHPIQTWLENQKKAHLIDHFTLAQLNDCDWERICLKDIKPIQIGKRLWICPTFETPPDPHACNLLLDPGLAFGTGTHPTTALCLAWLEHHIKGNETIIDYGCGSGILGLVALKLGAKHIHAIDLDPQALQATRENAKRNDLPTSSISCYLPNAFLLSDHLKSADILLANILLQPLIELASTFAQLCKENSMLVLSGILASQVNDIYLAYQPWFTFKSIHQQAEWVCLTANLTKT